MTHWQHFDKSDLAAVVSTLQETWDVFAPVERGDELRFRELPTDGEIVIGPKKLPDLAKMLGRAMGEFKKATSEIKQSMEANSDFMEVKDYLFYISTINKNNRNISESCGWFLRKFKKIVLLNTLFLAILT